MEMDRTPETTMCFVHSRLPGAMLLLASVLLRTVSSMEASSADSLADAVLNHTGFSGVLPI